MPHRRRPSPRCSALRRLVIGAGMAAAVCVGCADESARPVLGGPVSPDMSVPTSGQAGGAGSSDRLSERFGVGDLVVLTDGVERRWPVLVASTAAQRRQGLMEVSDLGGFVGMWFVFETDTETDFWMKDTPLALTVVFVDAQGSIVSMSDMTPCLGSQECPRYGARGAYRAALEVPRGRLVELGIDMTSTVALR